MPAPKPFTIDSALADCASTLDCDSSELGITQLPVTSISGKKLAEAFVNFARGRPLGWVVGEKGADEIPKR